MGSPGLTQPRKSRVPGIGDRVGTCHLSCIICLQSLCGLLVCEYVLTYVKTGFNAQNTRTQRLQAIRLMGNSLIANNGAIGGEL